VPVTAGDHAPRRQFAAQDHAVDVDVQNAPGDGVGLVDDLADGHDARVVDQDVDRAELALYLVEEIRERIPVCDIEFAVHVQAQVGAGLLHGRLVDVADGHLGAQLVQRGGGGQTDTAGTAGDHDDFAF
jgi:hypothetical protein